MGDLILRLQLSKQIFIAKLYSGDFISLLEMREHKHLNFKSLIFSHTKSFQDLVFHPGIGSIALLNLGISEIVQVSRKKQM